jgi:hypothetical protein
VRGTSNELQTLYKYLVCTPTSHDTNDLYTTSLFLFSMSSHYLSIRTIAS